MAKIFSVSLASLLVLVVCAIQFTNAGPSKAEQDFERDIAQFVEQEPAKWDTIREFVVAVETHVLGKYKMPKTRKQQMQASINIVATMIDNGVWDKLNTLFKSDNLGRDLNGACRSLMNKMEPSLSILAKDVNSFRENDGIRIWMTYLDYCNLALRENDGDIGEMFDELRAPAH